MERFEVFSTLIFIDESLKEKKKLLKSKTEPSRLIFLLLKLVRIQQKVSLTLFSSHIYVESGKNRNLKIFFTWLWIGKKWILGNFYKFQSIKEFLHGEWNFSGSLREWRSFCYFQKIYKEFEQYRNSWKNFSLTESWIYVRFPKISAELNERRYKFR